MPLGRKVGSKGTLGYSKTIPEPLPFPRCCFSCPLTLPCFRTPLQPNLSLAHDVLASPKPFQHFHLYQKGFVLALFLGRLFVCTAYTGTTPVSLLSSCISCNLLLPIKGYGEVHVEIRGSSRVCTGKCSTSYGEVHTWRTGKFTQNLRFPQQVLQKCTGKFTLFLLFQGVQGSSSRSFRRRCTGKFTLDDGGQEAVRGSSLLAKPSDAPL